jgi:hypothetical protein
VRVRIEPADELAHRDQPAASLADDAQLVHHVLLEEVDADAQGLGGFGLGDRQPPEPGGDTAPALLLLLAHVPQSRDPHRTPPPTCVRARPWERRERLRAASTGLERRSPHPVDDRVGH